jgi:hypothetical protein
VKRGQRILLISLASIILLTLASVLLWPRQPEEPEYHGTKLSQWLSPRKFQSAAPDTTAGALEHLGSNALPFMLRWVRYQPPAWRYKLDESISTWPKPISQKGPAKWIRVDQSKRQLARDTAFAFGALHIMQQRIAIPELTRLASRGNRNATLALENMRPFSIPALVELVQTRKVPRRAHILRLIVPDEIGTNNSPMIPILIDCLHDADPQLASTSAEMLAATHVSASVAVPPLAEGLRHPSPEVRKTCVYALSSYGREARAALPAITNCLADADGTVRQEATNAVRLIEP